MRESKAIMSEDTAPSPKDIIGLFSTATVRVPRTNGKGEPIRGDGGIYQMEERRLREADILAVAVTDTVVRIVTCDGRKLEARKPGGGR